MFCILRLDQVPGEVPPKVKPRLVPNGSLQERLDASVITEDTANNIHFSKRRRIAGSAGVVHVAMQVNISGFARHVRTGCEIPQMLDKKIDEILEREEARSVVLLQDSGNETTQRPTIEHQRAARRHRHYNRMILAMEKRCLFHLRSILDHMEIWIADFNNHPQEIVRDYSHDAMHMMRDDASSYLAEKEAKHFMRTIDGDDAEGESGDDDDGEATEMTRATTGHPKDDKKSRWQYWWRKYLQGKWKSYPHANYRDLPKMADGETVNYRLWSQIVGIIGEKIREGTRREKAILHSVRSQTPRPEKLVLDNHEGFGNFDNPPAPSSTSYDNFDFIDDISPDDVDGIAEQSSYTDIILRFPRQIVFGVIMGIIALSSLLFSSTQVDNLAATANHNLDQTIQTLNDQQHKLQIQEKSIKLLNKTVGILNRKISELDTRITIDELVTECDMTLNLLFAEVTRLLRGLSALSRNQLTPDLVSMRGLNTNLKKLRDTMENRGYVLGLERLERVFGMPVSYVLYGNGTLWAFVHINAYKKSSIYDVWEFNEIPFLTPSTMGDSAITIKPEKQLLGISEDNSRHVLLDKRTIDRCTDAGNMLVCEDMAVVNTQSRENCLSALFLGNLPAIKNTCRWYSAKRTEYIQEIGNNQFVGYFTEPDTIKITCSDGSLKNEKRVAVAGAVRITLQGRCAAYSNHHILEGRFEYTITSTTYQLNPINVSALLSNEYFTVSDKDWQDWEDIRMQIGSPEGIVFKDVGKLYWHYHTKRVWDLGLKFSVGIVIPLIIIGIILWICRGRITKCCKTKNNESPPQNYPPQNYPPYNYDNQSVHYRKDGDDVSLGGMSQTSRGIVFTPRPQIQGLPPHPMSSDQGRVSFESSLQKQDDPMKTPQTSKRLMAQVAWTPRMKQKILDASDMIRLSEAEEAENKSLMSEAAETEQDKKQNIP